MTDFFIEVNAALVKLDATLDYLMSELEKRELIGCVNIIFVSDHGLNNCEEHNKLYVSTRVLGATKIDANRFTILEDFINVTDPNVQIASNVVTHVTFER